MPLKSDMMKIRFYYDKSIESFFDMFRFLVNFNILTLLGFAYLLAMHFFDYNGSISALCATYFP